MTIAVANAILGHNRPPVADLLAQAYPELAADIAAFIKDSDDKAPSKIKDDTDLGVVGKIVTEAKGIARQVEGMRKAEKEPLTKATKELDGWFGDLTAKLSGLTERLEALATDYQRAKEAEIRRKAQEAAAEAARKAEAERAKAEAASGKAAARAEARAETFDEQATKAQAVENAKSADLVRTRTGGVTASATTFFDFEIEDYQAIPLDVLRPYLTRSDVEKAIRSFVKVNKDAVPLPGVRIFSDTRAHFR